MPRASEETESDRPVPRSHARSVRIAEPRRIPRFARQVQIGRTLVKLPRPPPRRDRERQSNVGRSGRTGNAPGVRGCIVWEPDGRKGRKPRRRKMRTR